MVAREYQTGMPARMEILGPAWTEAQVEARLRQLLALNARAGHGGIALLNRLGLQGETLLERLPAPLRGRLTDATEAALRQALRAARGSRAVLPVQEAWQARAAATAMGAWGGFGGLATAMAEMPVTVTLLLRSIEDVALEQGFAPDEPGLDHDCLSVFAAAGPLTADDGSDLAFLTTRLALSGATVQALIARVTPRLAAALGQKLAAQTVPVLGAAAGAAINLSYTSYYQRIAGVHFGLRRLAIQSGRDHAALVAEFRRRAGER